MKVPVKIVLDNDDFKLTYVTFLSKTTFECDCTLPKTTFKLLYVSNNMLIELNCNCEENKICNYKVVEATRL